MALNSAGAFNSAEVEQCRSKTVPKEAGKISEKRKRNFQRAGNAISKEREITPILAPKCLQLQIKQLIWRQNL